MATEQELALERPARRRRSRADIPVRYRPDVLGAIALGGALGGPARYGMAQWIAVSPSGFPWPTFWTNVSGSFLLGFVLVLILERFPPSRYLRPFVATGFLGAFTTYSTFAVETDLLIKDGHAALAIMYALGSLTAGFLAVWLGILLGRALWLRRGGRREARRPPKALDDLRG